MASNKTVPIVNRDNWRHRSARMSCESCMAFVSKEGGHPDIGRCRNHSPNQSQRGWPVVFKNDWCLDHKLDETKIK